MLHNSDLVHRSIQNDRRAQHSLYTAHAPALMGVCYRYTRNQSEASDVLQEGFVRIFRNLQQWRNDGPLEAWMRKIMVRTALNWLRDQRRLNVHIADMPERSEEKFAASTETLAYHNLEAADIIALIRSLPAGYQTIFNLHAIEGYAHTEIAELMNISESTSRTQYMRARRLLQQKLMHADLEKLDNHASRK